MRSVNLPLALSLAAALAGAGPAAAATFFFSTGNPDGRLAALSRPTNNSPLETETADDFVLTKSTKLTSASFTGLITGDTAPGVINAVGVEIYRVFPLDSDVGRTSGAPTFSTSQVPTRVNSPSDVEFVGRDSDVSGDLSFTAQVLAASFTAANSVVNGINPTPNQLTHGEGPVTGEEVQFNISFLNPITLPADHYFFVPQVSLTDGQNFLWLSATRPLVAPGTPFAPDLQSWIRNENLAPDWLRVGTDIVGGTTFNAAFTLTGVVSEPGSLLLVALAFLGMAAGQRRRSTAR